RPLLDLVEVLADPVAERARVVGVVETERRRSLDRVVYHGAAHPSRLARDLHAAVVARHQGALRCGQGNKELAPSMLAVDQKRAGEPEWHLGHAGEVFDVPAHLARIKGVTP